jgi:hypothetical protein
MFGTVAVAAPRGGSPGCGYLPSGLRLRCRKEHRVCGHGTNADLRAWITWTLRMTATERACGTCRRDQAETAKPRLDPAGSPRAQAAARGGDPATAKRTRVTEGRLRRAPPVDRDFEHNWAVQDRQALLASGAPDGLAPAWSARRTKRCRHGRTAPGARCPRRGLSVRPPLTRAQLMSSYRSSRLGDQNPSLAVRRISRTRTIQLKRPSHSHRRQRSRRTRRNDRRGFPAPPDSRADGRPVWQSSIEHRPAPFRPKARSGRRAVIDGVSAFELLLLREHSAAPIAKSSTWPPLS